jgi:ATP synthase protein I
MVSDPDDAKRSDLEARLRQAEGTTNPLQTNQDQGSAGASGIGFDFVGAIIGGAVLGWALDKVFPSLSPWGLIGLIVVGFGMGIVNVWRALMASPRE